MPATRAFAFSALATTLGLCLAVVLGLSWGSSPELSPGRTWTHGLLAGQDLRLLESGRYHARSWCDVCPPSRGVRGRWRREGDVIVLEPAGRWKTERRLRAVRWASCDFLVPLDSRWPIRDLHSDRVFRPAGERCLRELPPGQAAPWSPGPA